MRKFFVSQLFFIFSGLFFLTSVNATVIQVTNPGNGNDIQPNIQAAVDSAYDGDIISIPAGIFVFKDSVVITKFISIRGAGIGSTILKRPESIPDIFLVNRPMFNFDIDDTASSYIVVSEITFKSKSDSSSVALDFGIKMNKCVDFLITRCRFERFGRAAIYVKHTDTLARGLISNNEFYHNSKGSYGLDYGYGVEIYGDNYKWIDSPKFGTDNFIFIEDNLFDYHRHAIAAGGAGLYVARYNEFVNHLILHVIDTHNAQKDRNPGDENYFSTRAIEVYNNSIINTTFTNGNPIVQNQCIVVGPDSLTERAIAIRGAEALVHNNTISGFRFGCIINLYPTPSSADTAYPIPYTTGFLSGRTYGRWHEGIDSAHGNGDAFYWDNIFTIYNDIHSWHLPESLRSTDRFLLDRDYHTVKKPGYNEYTYPHPLKSLLAPTKFIDLKFSLEAMYPVLDTIKVFLANPVSPFQIIDSSNIVPQLGVNKFRAFPSFENVPGNSYYLIIKHRNSIETWSANPVTINSDTTVYDFTTSSNMAFGNNMKLVNSLPDVFGFYSGDVNQDDIIDLSDVNSIYNVAIGFGSGYLVTDLNGDGIIDLSDVNVAYNNSIKFVTVIRP